MKKALIVFTVVSVSTLFCSMPYSMAEQNTAPPLLGQQPAVHPPLPGVPPGPPALEIRPGPPAVTPPPAQVIGQTIPAQTLLNSLSIAVATVQKISSQLIPGKVWTRQGPAGEIELKAGILYRGSVVAVLHFDPTEGSVLPLGMPIRSYQNINQVQAVVQRIKEQIPAIISQLKILPSAEFRAPETSWAFPLTFDNRIVAHLKVYYDGIHIVPDYPANQEMIYDGQ